MPPRIDPQTAAELAAAVELCRRTPAIFEELARLYDEVDRLVFDRSAICLGGGGCCKFDLAGHRLYLSTVELAFLIQAPPADASRCSRFRCPYQSGNRCFARTRRPLGCRTFFCGEDAADWGSEIYEQFHRKIRELHEAFGVPYLYAELTSALVTVL